MEEYHLTPDEMIAKDFRMIQSSRRGYYPHGKSDWIATVKKVGRTCTQSMGVGSDLSQAIDSTA
jgi:hypothetical protein